MRAASAADAPPPSPPKVAIFPLGGNADAGDRQRVGFSVRTKLARDGAYDPIDGPTMEELAADAKSPITWETPAATIKDLADSEHPAILIWGDLAAVPGKIGRLRLNVLDLRDASGKPTAVQRDINQPTDLRFVVEDILAKLPGVKGFSHPSEEAVHHDAQSDAAWARNPNLVVNGDFAREGHWSGIYQSEYYEIKISNALPEINKVAIYTLHGDAGKLGIGAKNVLAMNLNREAAENNGLACLSDAIKIQPGVRYRLRFQFSSYGPGLMPFVKGYINSKDIAGKPALREVYRRQVPVPETKAGQWQTVECDLNPRHPTFGVEFLKVDLYAFLVPGRVMFDDVQLRAVGKQSPATQP